ncbi:MAG TPA: UDP-N-acetylmuramoyl-L-alanine--D-glutamate ligase [Sphingomicrobium sp.]|nr:UDP-N-acetylmuramoyl-L-alanine--D-glutamate ligase [Sphingomicrobium sp.]
MITARAFADKHYAVYGLARSGLATAEALLASGAEVTAWDENEEARAKLPGGAQLLDLDNADLSQFDSLVVTPGLPLNRHPIASRGREAGVEIIGDIELFARARPELPPHKVAGITGTNGKSTTTALVHHILQTAGVPSAMGGNIGLPILAQDPLPEGGVYVLELSSYQLDLTQTLECDVAVLLNITPDHLDRYDSFEAYAASKARLFEMQSPSNYGLVGTSTSAGEAVFGAFPRTCLIALEPWLKDLNRYSALSGMHNLENLAAASYVCSSLAVGLPDDVIRRGLESFPGLPHRMERVSERKGVIFVNDSKATNPTATAPALAAFPAIRWICGGRPKGDDLDECEPHFGHVRSAYTIGEAAELFERLLKPHMPVKNCRELEVAVKAAADDAEAGDTVLLSPACASFDQFKDFEERGDGFRAFVGAL